MNCNELRKDIDELKSSYATLQEGYNHMNNELSGKAEFKNNYHKTEQLSDKTLVKYLPDFIEKNPELFTWKLDRELDYPKDHFGKKIANAAQPKPLPNGDIMILADSQYNNHYDNKSMIFEYGWDESDGLILKKHSYSMSRDAEKIFTSLPDGTILAGGENLLYEIKDNEDNTFLSVSAESQAIVDGFEDNGDACISDAAPLPNGNILVGGTYRTFYEIKKNPIGKWETVKSLCSDLEGVSPTCITQMPDGAMLVGCTNGLYEYREDNNGDWNLSKRIECDNFVKQIFQLSDKKMLIVGSSALHEYNKSSDGGWRIEEKRNLLKERPVFATQLPNNEVIIIGEDWAFLYRKVKDGWVLVEDEAMEEAFVERSNSWPPDFIIPLSNNKLIVGGKYYDYDTHDQENIMVLLSRLRPSLEGLKQHLDTIIEKGEAQ